MLLHPDHNLTEFKAFGNAVMIGFGLLMLINPTKNHLLNIGFFALGFGLNRVLTAIPFVFTHYGATWMTSLLPIGRVYGIVILYVGANLVYTGIMFCRGYARSYRWRMYISSLIFVGTVFLVALELVFFEYLDPEGFVSNVLAANTTVLYGLMYGLLALSLNSEMVHRNGYYEKIAYRLDDLGRIANGSPNLVVERRDAEILFDAGHKAWRHIDDGSPAVLEHRFVVSDGKITQYVTAQIWKDEKCVYLTMSDAPEGTVIQALRFKAERIRISESRLGLYGTDGTMLNFPIRGEGL